jgi:hypothetical protein
MMFRRLEQNEARLAYDTLVENDIGMSVNLLSFSEFCAAIFPVVQFFVLTDGQTRLALTYLTAIDTHNKNACFGVVSFVRGEGHAADAIARTCRHAFDKVGLQRLYTYIDADNKECLTEAKSATPFMFEGIRRQGRFKNGGFVDQHQYSVIAEEFRTWAAEKIRES